MRKKKGRGWRGVEEKDIWLRSYPGEWRAREAREEKGARRVADDGNEHAPRVLLSMD
jgi:hypothetical protein